MSAIQNFLSQHAHLTQKVSVPAGSVICTEGQTCSHMVIITSGVVRVYKPSIEGRSISLYHISTDESCILTAGCILNNASFPAIAESKSEVSGIAVPAGLVSQWMNESKIWRNYMFSVLGARFTDVIELANSLAFEQLNKRIAVWINRNQTGYEIISTHQEIAEELGTSREVISRNLKLFEKQGIISLQRGKIVIVDNDKLSLV